MSRGRKQMEGDLPRVDYCPPNPYQLDLEVIPVSSLRRRVSADYLRSFEQIEFNLILYVAEGQCTHTIDFESVHCESGSLLVIHPGQAHCFDASTAWDGWLVLFRPEFLYPLEAMALLDELEMLPAHLSLRTTDRQAITESITRMYSDSRYQADTSVLHTLLRNQLCALLTRIQLICTKDEQINPVPPSMLQRFKRYKMEINRNYHCLHRVSDYARLLGCSEKSLNRVTREISGVSAKAFLMKRIVLEAKRLLIYTDNPVSSIAHKLGFEEATNFIKLFKRETGVSPGEFRRGVEYPPLSQ